MIEWLLHLWNTVFHTTPSTVKTFTSLPRADVTSDVAPGYALWPGARPEIEGSPRSTILAVAGLNSWTAEDRAAILDAAIELRCPVDSLAAVWSNESQLNPQAAYGIRHFADGRAMPGPGPDGYMLSAANETRVKSGRAPFYAVGILQLTVAAHLEGFSSNSDLVRVLSMTPAEQIRKIAIPLYRKMRVEGANPGVLYMKNFLPEYAGKPPDFVLGREDATGREKAIYDMNRGFDGAGKGYITVGDVYSAVGRVVRRAAFKRMTVSGEVLSPSSSTPSSSTPSSSTPSSSTPSSSTPSSSTPSSSTPSSSTPSSSTPSTPSTQISSDSAGHRLIAAVRAGTVEGTVFVEVPFAGDTLLVSTDALKSRVGNALLRLPVTWIETLEICNLMNLVPAISEVEDAVWQAAPTKIDPRPLGKWDTPDEQKESSRRMTSLDWCIRFNKECDAQIAGRSGLVRTVGKAWIFSNRLSLFPDRAVTYGWHYRNGKPIQGLGPDTAKPFHDDRHYDYSQTFTAIQRRTKNGRDVLDLYRSRGLQESVIALFTRSKI